MKSSTDRKARILARVRANQRTAAVRAHFAVSSVMGAVSLVRIMTQPLPRPGAGWPAARPAIGGHQVNMVGRGSGKLATSMTYYLDHLQAEIQAIRENPAATPGELQKAGRMARQLAVLPELINQTTRMSEAAQKLAAAAGFFAQELDRIRMKKRKGHHRPAGKKAKNIFN